MSKKPVVLYGASGYTGTLVAEYLREYQIPFIAAGRNKVRIEAAMAKVPGIETADYEVVAVDHTVEALTELFTGAEVVCNTVGPFAYFGKEVVEAAANAKIHYLDTGGEVPVLEMMRDNYGDRFEANGKVLAPSVAYMCTILEIATRKVLDVKGIDTISGVCSPVMVPSPGSFETIFAMFAGADTAFYIENKQRALWPLSTGYDVSVPGRVDLLLGHPWGGGPLPIHFENDPRVRNLRHLIAIANRPMVESVIEMQKMYEAEIRMLSPEEQRIKLSAIAESMKTEFTPRENRLHHRCMDVVHGNGSFVTASCSIRTIAAYQTTGAVQVATANYLLGGQQKTAGFTSGCGAVGHEELFADLQNLGLCGMEFSQSEYK